MADQKPFVLVGKVVGKQKVKKRDGSVIEGLWRFEVETSHGDFEVSCDETYPANGTRVPAPSFGVMQEALRTEGVVRIEGVVKDDKYYNARKVDPADEATAAIENAKTILGAEEVETTTSNVTGSGAQTAGDGRTAAEAPPVAQTRREAPTGAPSLEALLLATVVALLRMPEAERTGEWTDDVKPMLDKSIPGVIRYLEKFRG